MSKPEKTPEQLEKDYRSATDFFCGSFVDDMGLSLAARGVFFHLKRRADNTGVAKCGIRSISRICRIEPETVIKTIRELESRKLIECTKSNGRVSQYRLRPREDWCSRDQYREYLERAKLNKKNRYAKPNGFGENEDSNRYAKPNGLPKNRYAKPNERYSYS